MRCEGIQGARGPLWGCRGPRIPRRVRRGIEVACVQGLRKT